MDVLVIGGAACLDRDLKRVESIHFDFRLGVNDALYSFQDLDAIATLHPEHVWGAVPSKHWMDRRRNKGWEDIPVYSFRGAPAHPGPLIIWNGAEYWKGGSSGLYAVGVALHKLGADRVVLAGIPMNDQPNRYRKEQAWRHHGRYQQRWKDAKMKGELDRVRSLSGWTRILLNGE